MKKESTFFTSALLQWHQNENNRQLPWKDEHDPYKIWLSEVMLQQTRAEQGLKYYIDFTNTFPTICDLANAPDEQVFRMWQGLGYYNRCKNMLATARLICAQFNGLFPNTYQEILVLKGVGAYTAAAIASFAYDLPYAVVDGNVYRVLSRFFGLDTPIDTVSGKKEFAALAQDLLDRSSPGKYNQAIMDLGATVCTPKQAKCILCPLQKHCIAYKHNLIYLLPVKEKKLKVQIRYFNFFVFVSGKKVWIEKRNAPGIWQNLYQFYLFETAHLLKPSEISSLDFMLEQQAFINSVDAYGFIKQRLTHQLIHSNFFRVALSRPIVLNQEGFWVDIAALNNYAFPKTIVQFLASNSDNLCE